MQFNRDSNSYIVVFLVVMVLVVAVSLSFVNSVLKPTITKNIVVDTKSQILKSVVSVPEGKTASDVFTEQFVLDEYAAKVEEFMVDKDGNLIDPSASKETPFDVAREFKKELKKPEGERRYPIFKYKADDGGIYYILPLSGLGLWDAVWGYISLEPDFNTIKGTSFDHKGETPGLGARIASDPFFAEQFGGKKVFNGEGQYKLTILKGENNPKAQTDPNSVDGLSGATLTAQGVNAMLAKCIAFYEPYFEKNANK